MLISSVASKKLATARCHIKKISYLSCQEMKEISIIKNPLDASCVTFTLYRRQAADTKKPCYNTLSVRGVKTSSGECEKKNGFGWLWISHYIRNWIFNVAVGGRLLCTMEDKTVFGRSAIGTMGIFNNWQWAVRCRR